jgi:hypothetical protein
LKSGEELKEKYKRYNYWKVEGVEDDCFSFMDLEKALGSEIKSVKTQKDLLLENFRRKKDANGVERRTILIELTNP